MATLGAALNLVDVNISTTGVINVTDATIISNGTEAGVIEGFNSINLINTPLSGGVEKSGGIMVYQSMSGDAATGTGNVTITGGTFNATAGPAFYITNTDANINLTGVNVTSASGILLKAAGHSQWGTDERTAALQTSPQTVRP